MSPLTCFLSRLLGLYYLLAALSMFLHKQTYLERVTALIHDSPVMFVVLGSERAETEHRGVLAFTQAIGWSVLAEVPDREVVMGAVTQPWNPNVVFRPVTPDKFLTFKEPGYVKIAWTLRADPSGEGESIFRHETRVTTTDAVARARFRRYWSCFSPGIKLIRWLLLKPLQRDAEYRAAQARQRRG